MYYLLPIDPTAGRLVEKMAAGIVNLCCVYLCVHICVRRLLAVHVFV